VPEFTRYERITRCPTAYLSPTQGVISAADRAALEAYAAAREQVRREKAIARAQSGYRALQLTSTAVAEEVEPEPSVREDTGAASHPRRHRANLHRLSANPDDQTGWTFGQQSSESWISLINKARRLEAEATTATVKRHLRQLIYKYELLHEEGSAAATPQVAYRQPSRSTVRSESAHGPYRNRA
jgi:hypothetical protein